MNKRTAASHCPSHDGTAKAIREALAKSAEPLSSYMLSLVTGIKPEKIRTALYQLVSATGSVVALKGRQGKVYTLYRKQQEKPRAGSGQVAARREPHEFRELNRDMFAHQRLCELTRK